MPTLCLIQNSKRNYHGKGEQATGKRLVTLATAPTSISGNRASGLANRYASVCAQGRRIFVQFDLFADSEKNPAEFAINCITVPKIDRREDLQGKKVSVSRDDDYDDYDTGQNELAESVIVVADQTLELERLVLRFGKITDKRFEVTLKARCTGGDMADDESEISVSGKFVARIMGR
jgi:hypothetical protein